MRRDSLKPAVLQLIDSFNQGGSELQAVQLTRLLTNSSNFSVHLASLNPTGPLRAEVDKLGFAEIPSFPLTSFYDLNAVRQLKNLSVFLRQRNIQIIQTHDFYTNVFGMAAGALARTPVRIASMRETGGMRTSSQLKAQAFAYSIASHVVANSEAVQAKLINDKVPAKKISVLYNGLDLDRLTTNKSRREALAVLGLSGREDRQFVTIVANMRHDVKDYPMFLKAAQSIAGEVPQAEFLLAGEGELTEALKQLASELGIAGRTHFLGRCERVAELLNVSAVCVLSSKAEGFSNSIIEYMAASRPVVATDVGGAREAIVEGQTGYLVRSGDAKQLAARVMELLKDTEKAAQLGVRGRALVEQKFSTAAQLHRAEELYAKLLDQRKSN